MIKMMRMNRMDYFKSKIYEVWDWMTARTLYCVKYFLERKHGECWKTLCIVSMPLCRFFW